MRTRRSVAKETIRSQTQAAFGRRQVSQVVGSTVGRDYSAARQRVTGGTKTERTSPQRQGRYTLPTTARRFRRVLHVSPPGNVTARRRAPNATS